MNNFEKLGLSEPITKALEALGFETPSEIQEKSIPLLLEEPTDFIGLAQTGTGKTAAFGLPLLDTIDEDLKHIQALVLAPTRELGNQISEQLISFAKFKRKVRVQCVYGGVSITKQLRDLKPAPQVLVATPGRLIDMVGRKAIDLSKLKIIVLDEADEMLNMGFKEDIDKILSYTSDDKLTWLFSATMPKAIREIISNYMTAPKEVSVKRNEKVNVNIEHQYARLKGRDKLEGLSRLLDITPEMRGIVFCRTKKDTQDVAEELVARGYTADAIHGDLSQHQRDRVMKNFKNHTLQVLIATDVAARGIDVNDLSHVIHYSLPEDKEFYTHRSGRTARAGKSGKSIALVAKPELSRVRVLEKMLGINFELIEIPKPKEISALKLKTWSDKLHQVEITEDVEVESLQEIKDQFNALEKDELINKLIQSELSKQSHLGENRDINDTSTGRDRDRDRGGRDRDRGGRDRDRGGRDRDRGDRDRDRDRDRGDRRSSTMDKFFINVGRSDDFTKKDLVDYISSQTNIKKKDIGDIFMEQKFSFFQVNKSQTSQVAEGFNDAELNGRKLRVNQDEEKSSRGGSGHRGGGNRGGGNRGGNKRRY